MYIKNQILKIDYSNILPFLTDEELNSAKSNVKESYIKLRDKTGEGSEFLGWLDIPSEISEKDLREIEEAAYYLRRKSKVILVIGIGGSYLGSRAVIEALQNPHKLLQKKKDKYPLVVFAGQNLSEDYHSELLKALKKISFSIIIISKSGTTLEPAVAFRVFRQELIKRYGKEIASKRIIAITDKEKGVLKTLADKEGYKSFVIPDNVGGRYSVLTPVGLLPVQCAGLNIQNLQKGAAEMESFLRSNSEPDINPALIYAAIRNALYTKNKKIEILTSFIPQLFYFIEWWKQLYGESEGKNHKGIFPAGTIFSTDLHSMGQYIQEGERLIFETNIWVENPKSILKVPDTEKNNDGLNYLSGKNYHYLNENAMLGTMQAHKDGGVPNMTISIPELNEKNLGGLIYFFEFACAISGYTLGINPFDQPGVEAYKNNMFNLLGK